MKKNVPYARCARWKRVPGCLCRVLTVAPLRPSAAPGDLVVGRTTTEHTMKADRDPFIGPIIGKALGGLHSDAGVTRMLVICQGGVLK